jgi:hypothetical protein
MRSQQLSIIAVFWMRQLVASRHGVLFLVFFGLLHAMTALWTVMLADNLATMTTATGIRDLGLVYDVVSKGIDLERSTIEAILTNHPPILVALFSVAVVGVPWLTLFATFDQTASDISSRHMRFLLVRTDRATLYLGRALGALGFVALCEAVGLAILAGTLAAKGELGGLAGLLYVGRVWLTLVIYSAPFVALTAAMSAITGRPLWSLASSFAFWVGIVMVAGLGGLMHDGISNLTFILPTELKYNLISDAWPDLLAVLAHALGLGAVYLGIGYAMLRRRPV